MDNLHNIRGGEEAKRAELFRTPAYAFQPLLDYRPEWFEGCVLDPSAGDGRMIEAIVARGNFNRHALVDISPIDAARWTTRPLLDLCESVTGSYLTWRPERRFDAALTNPPFTLAVDFVKHALTHVDGPVCILQSVAWVGTQKRSAWLAKSCLRYMLNLPKRPRWEFDDGSAAASNIWDFAWYVFEPGYTGKPEIDWLL